MNYTDADYDAMESFSNELLEYLGEYEIVLKEKYSKRTVSNHCSAISFFTDEICIRNMLRGFEQIKYGMCASQLSSRYNSLINDTPALTTKLAKKIMREFFQFIYDKHGIINRELMNKLNK